MINLQESKKKKTTILHKDRKQFLKKKNYLQKNMQEMSEENIVANHRKLK
jgi:hypothetical protein